MLMRIEEAESVAGLAFCERMRRTAAIVDGTTYDIAAPEVFAHLAAHYEVDARFGAFALLRRK